MKKRTATALDSNTSLKIRIFDTLVVSSLFLSLLPVRVLFVEYVGDNWLGSFGLMTAIVTVVLYLTYKGKLGWFGRSVIRFFRKRHRKKRILIVIQFVFATLMLSTFIYAVNFASDDKYMTLREEIVALLPNEGLNSTEEIAGQAIDDLKEQPEMLLVAFVMFFYLVIYDFEKFALAMWTINNITGGLYLNLATIFLVEEIEVIGLFTFFHFFSKKIKQT